ncbi:MAG: EpsI family protein [Chthoniobacteraceae bacterium]
MITRHLLILQIVLLAGLSSIFLLPHVPDDEPAGIKLSLPDFVGPWYGEDAPVTQAERDALGSTTEFARKNYTDGRGNQLYVSIVLSGADMMTSIHRPERCLPAQGWTLIDSARRSVDVKDSGNHILQVTRLHSFRYARNQSGETINDAQGKAIPIYNLNYYWFIGRNTIVPSHYDRLYIDMRDRVLYGYNQRWAYVTVVSNVTDNLQAYGKNEIQTDKMIQDFIQQITPLIIKPGIRFD